MTPHPFSSGSAPDPTYAEHFRRHQQATTGALLVPLLFCFSAVQAQPAELEAVEVIGVTPTHGVGVAPSRLPYPVQQADGAALRDTGALGVGDLLDRQFGSISRNDAQNNPLQPDIQFRGFTASPLLGLPQGLSVYQNSVRINEAFGDTVNWDLIPDTAIRSINLISGANPLFGLNTLGGAISVETKTGFSHPGHAVEVSGGSFGRVRSSIESGANNGRFSYFATVEHFDEDGWRDASPSEAIRAFASLGFRPSAESAFDLNLQYADTDLIGNGAVPIELLAQDRDAIFTAPDNTKNTLAFVDLQGSHQWSAALRVSGNVFYRDNDSEAFNGDGSEFEECEEAGGPEGFLCEEDDDEPIEDQNGQRIAEAGPGGERNAINNRSLREQRSFGGSLQMDWIADIGGLGHHLIAGAAYHAGLVDFLSNVEVAGLTPERSTRGTGLFVPEEGTAVTSSTRTWSLYVSDTIALSARMDLTLSGRFNQVEVELKDRGGTDAAGLTQPTPRLNGKHQFSRFNPAAGLRYRFAEDLSSYLGYSESTRAPTAIELACAEPDAPCNLPNSFLADPPLEQVVARNIETGLEGVWTLEHQQGRVQWGLGAFATHNDDDILFQSTGGVQSNEGFFDNVGDTRRMGLEARLDGQHPITRWYLRYSYVRAQFVDPFTVNSPNNPRADDDGQLAVANGDRIPGIPQHTLKLGADWTIARVFDLGVGIRYASGVHLRGDEANVLPETDGFATINLRAAYRPTRQMEVFARIENLLDAEYETFGLLGEADEIPGFEDFEDNRFLGPGQPLAAFVGLRWTL